MIGGFGVDQGEVGGLVTPPSGQAWCEEHLMYDISILGSSWDCG